MTCESCVREISGSLYKLSGIQKVEANIKDQLVTITGTCQPTTLRLLKPVLTPIQLPLRPS